MPLTSNARSRVDVQFLKKLCWCVYYLSCFAGTEVYADLCQTRSSYGRHMRDFREHGAQAYFREWIKGRHCLSHGLLFELVSEEGSVWYRLQHTAMVLWSMFQVDRFTSLCISHLMESVESGNS